MAILGKYQGTNFGPSHIALLSEVLGINGHLIDVQLVDVDLSGRNYYPDTPLRPLPRETTLLSGMWWCVWWSRMVLTITCDCLPLGNLEDQGLGPPDHAEHAKGS